MSIKPLHYTQYAIEPIDYIESKKYDFSQGNIIKYILRYKQKDGLKDLQKAEFYCKRLIEFTNKQTRVDIIYKNIDWQIVDSFCEKNKLEPKIIQIVKLIDNAHCHFDRYQKIEYLQNVLLIIQELQKEYK